MRRVDGKHVHSLTLLAVGKGLKVRSGRRCAHSRHTVVNLPWRHVLTTPRTSFVWPNGLFSFGSDQTRSNMPRPLSPAKGLLTLIHHIDIPPTLISNHSIQPTRRPCPRTRTGTEDLAEPPRGNIRFEIYSQALPIPSKPSLNPPHIRKTKMIKSQQ